MAKGWSSFSHQVTENTRTTEQSSTAKQKVKLESWIVPLTRRRAQDFLITSPALPATIGHFRRRGLGGVSSKQLSGNMLQLCSNILTVWLQCIYMYVCGCGCVCTYRGTSVWSWWVCTVCTEDCRCPLHTAWLHKGTAAPQNPCWPWNTANCCHTIYWSEE